MSQPEQQSTETLQRVMKEIGWQPEPAEGDITGFVVDFGEPHVPIATALAAIAPGGQFIFYINFGYAARPDRRDECARLLARLNSGLTIGSFEMDYDDGQIRCKSSVDFGGGELTENLVRNTILGAMKAIEAYAGAVTDVVMRGGTAADAAARAQQDQPES